MTNNIATYLKYANVQMAAEALFEFNPAKTTNIITPGSVASYANIRSEYLTDGNNRSSKFTAMQAADFAASWTVEEKLGSGLAKQHTI